MVIALSLTIMFSAGLTIYCGIRGTRWLQYITKPLTTILIITLGVLKLGTTPDYYRVLIVIGLVFSLLGDILLMLPQSRFIPGLVSFLITHLLYTIAFIPGIDLGILWLLPMLFILIAMTAILWPKLGRLRVPVLVYALVIIVMAWRALARLHSLDNASAVLAAAGALAFCLSDALLAVERFRTRFKLSPLLVLGSYYLAQWLIVMSI
ncbi:MAG: lysoplasmalogenase [Anaerolineae bacterium]